MQDTAILDIDFRGFDLPFGEVLVPGQELIYHQGRGQAVKIPPDCGVSDSEGTCKLRGVPGLAVVMGQHGPEPSYGVGADMDAKLREIFFKEGADIALTPFMAFERGVCKIRARKTASEPKCFMVVNSDFR